jgi:transcriptional antiterminator Rof (Rho-off)
MQCEKYDNSELKCNYTELWTLLLIEELLVQTKNTSLSLAASEDTPHYVEIPISDFLKFFPAPL